MEKRDIYGWIFFLDSTHTLVWLGHLVNMIRILGYVQNITLLIFFLLHFLSHDLGVIVEFFEYVTSPHAIKMLPLPSPPWSWSFPHFEVKPFLA